MIEQELAFDSDTQIRCPVDIAVTAATCTLYAPSGAAVQTPPVTLPALSTTVAAGSTATTLILGAVTGLQASSLLRVVDDGATYLATAATVDSATKTVTLRTALPVVPATGAAVTGAELTATVTAPGSAAVGGNYRLVWVATNATETRTISQAALVVRWAFAAPCGAAEVREILADFGAGQANRSNSWCQDVADRVSDKIRGKLAQTGRRPSLYLSPSLFSDIARAGIRAELATRGIALGGQVYEAQRETRFAFDDGLATLIQSLQAYDSNGDGEISTAEAKPKLFTIRMRR